MKYKRGNIKSENGTDTEQQAEGRPEVGNLLFTTCIRIALAYDIEASLSGRHNLRAFHIQIQTNKRRRPRKQKMKHYGTYQTAHESRNHNRLTTTYFTSSPRWAG
jgi:hypothetical protein